MECDQACYQMANPKGLLVLKTPAARDTPALADRHTRLT